MSQPLPSPALVTRLLDVIEHDIVPLTRKGVARGSKIFGAAILRKADLSLVLAETNNEMESPLWHGETHAIKRFHELPGALRPPPRDCIFLATHEPCSLCLSAITWAGFDNFYYLFSHEDSRDAFSIPHDLRILKEVFGVSPGCYNRRNVYWSGHSITELATALEPADSDSSRIRVANITALYEKLSQDYQRSKQHNDIPLN